MSFSACAGSLYGILSPYTFTEKSGTSSSISAASVLAVPSAAKAENAVALRCPKVKLQHAAAILWQRKRCSIIGFPPCFEGRRNDDFHGIPRFSLRWCRVWHHTSPQASVIISVSIPHHFVYVAVGCMLPEVLFRNHLTETIVPDQSHYSPEPEMIGWHPCPHFHTPRQATQAQAAFPRQSHCE